MECSFLSVNIINQPFAQTFPFSPVCPSLSPSLPSPSPPTLFPPSSHPLPLQQIRTIHTISRPLSSNSSTLQFQQNSLVDTAIAAIVARGLTCAVDGGGACVIHSLNWGGGIKNGKGKLGNWELEGVSIGGMEPRSCSIGMSARRPVEASASLAH